MLRAYWLTDVDEINRLGIEILYREKPPHIFRYSMQFDLCLKIIELNTQF